VDPSVRTVETIPSNAVFIGQLMCAFNAGDIPPFPEDVLNHFFLLITEEELRRKQKINAKLDAEVEKEFIEPQVSIFKNNQTKINSSKAERIKKFYEEKLKLIIDGEPAVWNEGQETIADCLLVNLVISEEAKKLDAELNKGPEKFDGSFVVQDMSKQLQTLIKENEDTFQNHVIPLLAMKPLMGGRTATAPQSLKELGVQTLEQVAAMVIQNAVQFKNSDRKQAVTDGSYMSPFTKPKEVLKYLFAKVVQSEKERRMREFMNGILFDSNALVQSYVNQYMAILKQKGHSWELMAIKHLEMIAKRKPIKHRRPICDTCHHVKPDYAGFRCVCGCMDCFTSWYFTGEECD